MTKSKGGVVMRKLTIKREKSFVGSVMKMKVYAEDRDAKELTILNTPCRKLGEVKNGGELTVEIDEASRMIFVIGDLSTKDTCVGVAEVPAGSEDVTLRGKNRFAPLRGNPFVFEK